MFSCCRFLFRMNLRYYLFINVLRTDVLDVFDQPILLSPEDTLLMRWWIFWLKHHLMKECVVFYSGLKGSRTFQGICSALGCRCSIPNSDGCECLGELLAELCSRAPTFNSIILAMFCSSILQAGWWLLFQSKRSPWRLPFSWKHPQSLGMHYSTYYDSTGNRVKTMETILNTGRKGQKYRSMSCKVK